MNEEEFLLAWIRNAKAAGKQELSELKFAQLP